MNLLIFISSMFYRAGGKGHFFNTKWRDFGCPIILIITMYFAGIHAQWYIWAVVFLINFAALTTYWDWINKYLPVADPNREYWWNWALHGFGCAIATLPLVIWGSYETGAFLWRLGLLPVLFAFWSELIDDDEIEELGRGALLILTLV